ncbi:sensor histidine kinase [[Clostridium] hylemonae]|uniref:sensor histidine kinase n=1 Tax=[Clostridium] hylemonae TaxID=89153 RepID=UPI001FCA8100|nr:HAMP domain-containing sensor histidine kinase [[Clostridium] hylemonae]BDF06489.1 hypothetical protein CE91St63_35510 [[Clostridium] hylemonae]
MFTTTDFDKLQQIMDESPEKKELLQKLLESQKMTISSISHEIRNPLTLVYSTLQLIEAQHPEVSTYKYWDSMRSDVEYMTILLEELSAFNNGESLSLSEIDCSSFLRPVVLSFAASLTESSIEFTSKLEPDLPVICGDAVKLREVILNLLQNAKDAVDPDGAIYFHAFTEAGNLCISVRDNGCGIPQEDMEHIFEPFVTYKQGGTGLGLAIGRRIASAHKGTLSAVSVPGGPTVFTLSLPIEKNA